VRPGPVAASLLLPAAMLYDAGVRLRARLYRAGVQRARRLNGVVISVGNLTVGGTGKTPMVLWLAERLLGQGRCVGILTRGYRGAGGTSDEVELYRLRLADRVALGVGPDRFAQGRALESQGAEWFLLDDGFQHLGLARDVDIVLVDATDPFGGGRLLPSGRLREPKSALARADIVVLTRTEHAPALESIVARHTPAPVFYATTRLEEVVPGGHSRILAAPGEWCGRRLFAFCTIANPAAFFDDLRRWGMDVAGHAAFPDHHRYTQADMAAIERRAEAVRAEALVATEKDIFNLGRLAFARLPLYHCRIGLHVREEEKFCQAMETVLARKRGAAR
jgi:tetraacyldisaccharide 4'-kinase